MRSPILLLLPTIALCACATVQTRVTGDLLVSRDDEAPTAYGYEAVETHSMTGTMVACILTGIFYGGACWAYLAAPYDGDKRAALEHAHEDATRIGRCTDLVSLKVEHAGWRNDPRSFHVKTASGRLLTPREVDELCRAGAAPAAVPPPTPTPSPSS